MRYLVSNPLVKLFLFCMDLLPGAKQKKEKVTRGEETKKKGSGKNLEENSSAIEENAKILLANGAHLGDIVMATSTIYAIRKQYPKAKIGMIVGSWAVPVIKKQVDYLHVVDHFKHNRAKISCFRKLVTYIRTRKKTLEELKRLGYDVGIDLYYHFPNTVYLLKKAGIPRRIGYTSGGFGKTLTHPEPFYNQNKHVTRYYGNLLKHIGIASPTLMQKLRVKKNQKIHGKYIVLHLGSGSSVRKWSLKNWKTLSQLLKNYTLVFVGKGKQENKDIEAVNTGINLCNKLSFSELNFVIKKSALVIANDSVVGHIAATFKVPSITLFAGVANPYHFGPLGKQAVVLREKVPCFPCYNKKGCSSMLCIEGVLPKKVFDKAESILQRIEKEQQSVQNLFADPLREKSPF